MSDHNGVRMVCPSCTLSCVMHNENEIPPGINKRVEGMPFCNNCNLPMEPSGSVATKNGVETLPPAVVADDVPIEKRLEVIRQAQTEVDQAAARYKTAADAAKDRKKEWENKVDTLGVVIRRLTQVPAPLPLFDGTVERGSEGTGEPMTEVPSLIETAALTEMTTVAKRLEAIGFSVTVEQLDALSFDAYQEVERFLEARENGNPAAVPECLHAPADEDEPAEPPRRRGKRQDAAHA